MASFHSDHVFRVFSSHPHGSYNVYTYNYIHVDSAIEKKNHSCTFIWQHRNTLSYFPCFFTMVLTHKSKKIIFYYQSEIWVWFFSMQIPIEDRGIGTRSSAIYYYLVREGGRGEASILQRLDNCRVISLLWSPSKCCCCLGNCCCSSSLLKEIKTWQPLSNDMNYWWQSRRSSPNHPAWL